MKNVLRNVQKMFKKGLLLVLVLSLFSSILVYPKSIVKAEEDEVKKALAIYGTPEIDGIQDDVWLKSNPIKVEKIKDGKNPNEPSTVKTMWDENYIYVFAEINDKHVGKGKDANDPWDQDSVEIFIDEDNGKSEYDSNDYQYRISFENRKTGRDKDADISLDDVKSQVEITNYGFAVEVAIPLKSTKGMEGKMIGFDLQINDDSGTGHVDSRMGWNTTNGNTWWDASLLGNLRLVKSGSTDPFGDVEIKEVKKLNEVINIPAKQEYVNLPVDEKIFWGKEHVEKISDSRERIILNGLWGFMPAVESALAKPVGKWGFIRVPGFWAGQTWGSKYENENSGIVSNGKGTNWDVDIKTLTRAWYQRSITVPKNWIGKDFVLKFNKVATDAVVYITGKAVSFVKWPFGEVVISDFVKAGETADLLILSIASKQSNSIENYKSVPEDYNVDEQNVRGISGDVYLESRTKKGYIEGVFVKTSVEKKQLGLNIDLANLQGEGKVDFTVEVKDMNKKVIKTFKFEKQLSGEIYQTITENFNWIAPKLWDFKNPNLYTLAIKADGDAVKDNFDQKFGFREFLIKGKDYYLNGKIFRAKPVNESETFGVKKAMENQMDGLIENNFNLIEFWPWDHYSRGSNHYRELMADVADEKGFTLMYPMLPIDSFSSEKRWKTAAEQEWKRIRNHPSIIMFVSGANAYGFGDDMNPNRIGNSQKIIKGKDSADYLNLVAKGTKCIDLIKKMDATRPVTSHNGGIVGDIQTTNMYLDLIPLQEREDWLNQWSKSGDKPFMAVEFGNPFTSTFLRARDGFVNSLTSEPLATEYSAIYLGKKAYEMETDLYRKTIKSSYIGGMDYSDWENYNTTKAADNVSKVVELFNNNTWKSFRTWGLSGGLLSWEPENKFIPTKTQKINLPKFIPGQYGYYQKQISFSDLNGMSAGGVVPNAAGQAIVNGNNSVLVWIAGGSKQGFTDKTHNYYSDSTVEKQIVVINDTTVDKTYDIKWSVSSKETISTKNQKGVVKPGEIKYIPISFKAPKVSAKKEYIINVSANISKSIHKDSFTLRVFPKNTSLVDAAKTVFIFDPIGETKKYLNSIGVKTKNWNTSNSNLSKGLTLVIGRNAFLKENGIPDSVERFAAEGGKVVIFAQDPQWLKEKGGFRVADHVSRRFYPIDTQKNSPIIKGLDEQDFRDWAGSGSLISETKNTEVEKNLNDTNQSMYEYHWGNKGSVSSCAIEKPHRSSWTPILEGEFDLAYSPLMEMNYKNGSIIMCTLDMENRKATEPVADITTKQLLNYIAQKGDAQPTKTTYVGGIEGKVLLDGLGIDYSVSEIIPSEKGLLIVGSDYKYNEAKMKKYIHNGGKVFFLPQITGANGLGFKVTTKDNVKTQLNIPNWNELKGISISDIHFKTNIKASIFNTKQKELLIDASGLLAKYAVGKGSAVFMQLTPDMLQAQNATYLRTASWKVTRTMSQILSNMGAQFKTNEDIFSMGKDQMTYIDISKDWQYNSSNKDSDIEAVLASEDWNDVNLIGNWNKVLNGQETDGTVWFKKQIEIPKEYVGKDLKIELGQLKDKYTVFVNRQKVTDAGMENQPLLNGVYNIKAVAMTEAKLEIVIKANDKYSKGGFSGICEDMKLSIYNKNVNYYYPGYRLDYELGDNPYRFFRW